MYVCMYVYMYVLLLLLLLLFLIFNVLALKLSCISCVGIVFKTL